MLPNRMKFTFEMPGRVCDYWSVGVIRVKMVEGDDECVSIVQEYPKTHMLGCWLGTWVGTTMQKFSQELKKYRLSCTKYSNLDFISDKFLAC